MRVNRFSQTTRDANEPELLRLWRRLGGEWVQAPPLDGWAIHRGIWTPTEIKIPEREGLAHEYTPAQRRFLTLALAARAPVFIWRTADDVLKSAGARATA